MALCCCRVTGHSDAGISGQFDHCHCHCQWSVWSVVSVQWLVVSVVSVQCSVVSGQCGQCGQCSVFSGQWLVVNGQWLVVSGQWLVVSGQWSVWSVLLVTLALYIHVQQLEFTARLDFIWKSQVSQQYITFYYQISSIASVFSLVTERILVSFSTSHTVA